MIFTVIAYLSAVSGESGVVFLDIGDSYMDMQLILDTVVSIALIIFGGLAALITAWGLVVLIIGLFKKSRRICRKWQGSVLQFRRQLPDKLKNFMSKIR